MNIKSGKILGIPLALILLSIVSSAAIIIAGVAYMNTASVGTLTNQSLPPTIAPNFSICDGDFTDNVTFSIDANNQVQVKFPLWLNRTVEYRGVALITPFQTGNLIISEAQRTNNGPMSGASMQIYDLEALQYDYPFGVPATPGINAFAISVMAGSQYELSYRIQTVTEAQAQAMGLKPNATDSITFRLEVR